MALQNESAHIERLRRRGEAGSAEHLRRRVVEAEISAFRAQRHDRARRLGHSPRHWMHTTSAQPIQKTEAVIQRAIQFSPADAADKAAAKTYRSKTLGPFLESLRANLDRLGDHAMSIKSQLVKQQLNPQIDQANTALKQEPYQAGDVAKKLGAMVATLNELEAELAKVEAKLLGEQSDFTQKQGAIARVQELDQRFDELDDMRTGPVPVADLQSAHLTMDAAKTAAHTAANAAPYVQSAAQSKTLDYVLAMDAFEEAATAALPDSISQTMQFGTEFTFTQPAIHRLDTEKNDPTYVAAAKLVAAWEAQVRAQRDYKATVTHSALDGGAAQAGQNAAKFTYQLPSGRTWWWNLDIDYGCLETQAQPTTEAQAGGAWDKRGDNAAIKGIIASHIFGLAATVGVKPHGTIGGGHLSLDRATTFGDNARFLRNFLVLYVNERGNWAREDPDAINAPLITDLKTAGKMAFKDVIRDFDADHGTPNAWSVEKLTDELNTKVFIAGHFAGDGPAKRKEQPAHYQATNLEHMTSKEPAERRIEMRRFDAQTSLTDLLADMAKLTDLTARSRQPGLVPLSL